MELLEEQDCLSDNQEFIDISKLRQRIKIDKTMKSEVFNQLLRQDCEYKTEFEEED